jgi:RND family efflux transporter MFP subunit
VLPRAFHALALVLGLAALAGCEQKPADATAKPASEQARVVRLVPAEEGNLPRTVPATGTLAAEDQVVLNTKVAGRLDVLSVDLGSAVRAGDVVAVLDLTDFRLRAEQAETALAQARARLGVPLDGSADEIEPGRTALVRQARAVLEQQRTNRARVLGLHRDGILASAARETAEADFRVAEARYQEALEEVRNRQAVVAERRTQLRIAEQQLADATLRAPFDGVVRERHLSVGAYLAVGAPVVTIVRMHPLRLRLAVPEREAASVHPGLAVRLRIEGERETWTGKIARLSPAVDEGTRTVLVEAEVPNEDNGLRPGAFASAEIVVEPERPAVLVPEGAVVTFAGVTKVLTVADGHVVERRIRPGRRLDGRVEVLDGLAAGEPVVAQPGNLAAGQRVVAEP